ncbi:MAG: hypothetical protein ACU84J_01780 [Gammaproteobacteria bacterium]
MKNEMKRRVPWRIRQHFIFGDVMSSKGLSIIVLFLGLMLLLTFASTSKSSVGITCNFAEDSMSVKKVSTEKKVLKGAGSSAWRAGFLE